MKYTSNEFGKAALHKFQLIEMLIVISVISILFALLIPALNQVVKVAHAKECIGKQSQLLKASHLYVNDHRGEMPGKGGSWTKRTQLGQYVGNESDQWFKLKDDIFFCPSAGDLARYRVWNGDYASAGIAINGGVAGYGAQAENILRITTEPGKWAFFVDGISTRWAGWAPTPCFDDLDPNATWKTYSMSQYWSIAFNYARRHQGKVNVGFLDGHVSNSEDLRESIQEGDIYYSWSK